MSRKKKLTVPPAEAALPDPEKFPHLAARLAETFGVNVPAEVQARADAITQDGVITQQEWAEFLDFLHEWTLKTGTMRYEGDAVFIDFPTS